MLVSTVVAVFTEFLERNRREILRQVEALVATEQGYPSSAHLQRLDELVEELIAMLRSGASPLRSRALHGSPGTSIQQDDRELIRGVVIAEAIRQSSISVEDTVLVSDWAFATKRRQLSEGYRRLSELLDDIDDGVGIISAEGRIEYLNKALAVDLRNATAVPVDEIVGSMLAELGLPSEHSLSREAGELMALAHRSATDKRLILGRWKQTRFKALRTPSDGVAGLSVSIRDIHDPRFAEIRLAVLSKLSSLVGSVNYDDLADALAMVPVPHLADWCVVHIVEAGHIAHSAVSRGDPTKAAVREAIMRAFPDWEKHPLWEEMRLTSGFQLLTDVGDELRRRIALNEEQYRLMTQEGVHSIMVLPVVSRGQTAALMTLMFTTESGRRYSHDHPPLAEELALHAGNLIENARLLRELRMNEARFKVSIAGVRAVVFEHDRDLRYSWFYNPVTATPSFVGRTDEEMLGAEDAAVLTDLKRRALRGESVREEVDVTVGGMTGHFREALEPMRDRAGEIIGIIGSATDISDENRTQQRLQESLVFRDRMMGVLSHDLKNPLSAITMAVRTMLREKDPAGADHRKLQIVERSAKRMLEMVETLLDFTRVQSGGRLRIRPVATDLGALARDVVDEMRVASPDLTIKLQLHGNLLGQVDPSRIDQVLSNLIANALQYDDPERPVRVSLDGNGEVVELRVMNEGPAIPPDLIPVLFEPFTRGTSETARHGLGLGLYITKQIVLVHGGEIHVESTDQTGTQFSVILPVRFGAETHSRSDRTFSPS